jgi:arginyl-tRNA synthetase
MIVSKIENILNSAVEKLGIEKHLSVSFSNMTALCDFQCNGCFALAKELGTNQFDLAQKIVENVLECDLFEFSVAKPAFINIKLTQKAVEEYANACLNDENGGLAKHKNPQNILLDYGGANVAKALHIGHLRPAIIGESLKRLYKLLGDNVISDVHLGDWGLQMGLTALELYEEGVLGKYFKEGEDKPLTLAMLNYAYPQASKRKNEDEAFRKKAEEWTLKIQNKEEPYYSIYKEIRAVSVADIKENYAKLGAQFDLWYGESDASDYTAKAVQIIKDRGLARQSEGATIVDVALPTENQPIPKKSPDEVQRYLNPMPPCIIEKSNGASLYATTDIATILMRNETYKNLDRIEYVTDARQHMHFTQVFRVCKMSGISPEEQTLLHIGHGTMNGKDGKPFKTRSGDTLKLEDIVELLINKANEKLLSNGGQKNDDLALKIGVSAMKFGDLSNTVGKDYLFDIDKFMAFEGKTGPYLQYSVVRINSILSKLGDIQGGQITADKKEIRDIVLAILKLNSAYEICYREKSLNTLCNAVYELASNFSVFYNNHSVLGEKDKGLQAGYASLLKLVRKKMTEALNVLAIEVPEKM